MIWMQVLTYDRHGEPIECLRSKTRSIPAESIARAMNNPNTALVLISNRLRWFPLVWHTASIIPPDDWARRVAAGHGVLVVTLDDA